MRLDGEKLADISAAVGLSHPTIISAHKAFLSGGWAAVSNKQRGRSTGTGSLGAAEDELRQLLCNSLPESAAPDTPLWSPALLVNWIAKQRGIDITRKTAGRQIDRWQLLTPAFSDSDKIMTSGRKLPKFRLAIVQQHEHVLFSAEDARRQPLWLHQRGSLTESQTLDFLARLLVHAGRPFALQISGISLDNHPTLAQWFSEHQCEWQKTTIAPGYVATQRARKNPVKTKRINAATSNKTVNATVSAQAASTTQNKPITTETHSVNANSNQDNRAANDASAPIVLDHLNRLEAESIRIIREAIAEGVNPVMLFSMGKDSIVLLHLAKKACFPASLPFPLLHIDTTWKFHAMYEFRENVIANEDVDLLVHTNNTGIEQQVNPLTHGAELHTSIMKTDALKQAIEKHGFDLPMAGSRRDEEVSRSKERIFSFRNDKHQWDPKNQRPEVWNLYNTAFKPGETLRVYPLSNWTETDIWEYIQRESISVPSLYFAAERPVVERDGMLIMVDDDRLTLKEGEVPMMRQVRFRTLGCYPLTGAFESTATTVPEIINELRDTELTERSARLSARLTTSAMEKNKMEGYF